jgi:hypothetical protein
VRKILLAALVVAAVTGAAAAALPLVERYAAARIKADLERSGAGRAGSVEVGLFDRRIVIDNLQTTGARPIKVGHSEISGLSWPISELARGHAPFSGLALGDPINAGHVELRDLQVPGEGANWSAASVVIDDLRLERYEPLSGHGDDAHLAARLAAALTMRRVEQKQAAFVDPEGGDRIGAASVVIERFDKGQIGAMVMSGFELTSKPPRDPVFRMADFRLTDLDLRRALKAIGAAAWRPGVPIGRVDLGSSSLSGFGGEAMSRYGVSLASISSRSEADREVRHSRLRIDGFVLDPPAGTREALQLRVVLQAMGLKQLKLEAECDGTEDRAKGEIALDRCLLGGPDVGEATFSFKLVNADAPLWQAIDDGNTFALLGSKAGLGGAKVVVADRGLLERIIKAVAATRGESPAAVRVEFAQQVRRYQPPNVLITEELGKLLDTVARFIEQGGTITLEAKPDSPVGIDKAQYFARPGPDLVGVLGLSASLSR